MGFWRKIIKPMRRVCYKVAKGIGLRKTGHGKLRHDVQSCEYEDVRILWEMLKRNETEVTRSATRYKKDGFWHSLEWARCAPLLSRSRPCV